MNNSRKAVALPIPRRLCNVVFYQHHDNLRRYLNFHSIYPLLNSRGLLNSSLDQSILTSPTITTEQRVDIVLSWLPKSSQSDYLTPFMECLLESAEQAGEAHRELAHTMRAQVEREMDNFSEGGSDTSNSYTDVERDGPAVHGENRNGSTINGERERLLGGLPPHKRTSSIVLKGCIICSIIFLLMSIVWIIITVTFIKVIPKNLSRNMKVTGDATVFLVSDIEWLQSITVTFFPKGDCVGTLAFIEGCSDLHISIKTHGDCTNRITNYPNYALQGSTINITVPSNFSSRNIWITGSLDAANNPNGVCPHDGESPVSDTYCYHSENHTKKPINFQVPKPGFYHSILTHPNDMHDLHTTVGIKWACTFRTYNLSLIKSKKSVNISEYKTKVAIESQSFRFKDSCALLEFNCPTNSDHGDTMITVSNLELRWDIIVLIFIIYFLCVILSIAFVITSMVLCLKFNKCRKCQL